jgi:hypothetical protein
VRSLILVLHLLVGSSHACSFGESEPFSFKRPLSAPSASRPAPDVRVESFELLNPGPNSATCEGVALLTLSVSKELVPPGTGLVLEQVTPAPYVFPGPHGSFEPSFERGGRLLFVFALSRDVLTSQPINVTARGFVVTADGLRGDHTLFHYSLPVDAAL